MFDTFDSCFLASAHVSSRVEPPHVPRNIPLADTGSVRRNASYFMFPTPFASKCIANSSFSCLHAEDGAHVFGRSGGLPVGARGVLHCGEVRTDAKKLVSRLRCELKTQTRAMNAPTINTKIAVLQTVPVALGPEHVACKNHNNKMPCSHTPNKWLTSGIQSED
jgi:hypothetical protein